MSPKSSHTQNKFKTISDREMEAPDFKKRFEETWPAFQLEVRLLNAMKNRKLPHFKTREEEAQFWNTHSMTDYMDELEPADKVFTLATSLAEKIRERAKTRAVSLRRKR